jgi:predicted Zn-dependent peptidase
MADRDFRVAHLSNGLTLLGEVSDVVQSASIGFFVRTGARDETVRESGVSHFLEHMLFKGTQKRSAMEITYELGNIGAQANAFTTEENTVYYAAVLKEYFPAMQELLCDMLRPSLDPKEFDLEKKVILEEIALYEDRPHFYLFEHAMLDFFSGHPAGNSVLGTNASIAALSRAQMKEYFDRRYSPGNLVLIAAGNYNWDRFVADAEKYCGTWIGPEAPREVARYRAREMFREYRKKDIKQAHILLMTDAASAQDEERYPFTILSMILGDSSGSKIYWQLIDSGLVESAGAECDERDGTGVMLASASMEPNKLEEVALILREIMSKPLDFSDADLDRAKTKLAAKIVLGGELPMGRMMAMGTEWQYRKKVTPLTEIINRVRSVTRKEIEQALERFPLTEWAEFHLLAG